MPSIADVYVTVLPETGKIADGVIRAFRDVDPHAREAGKRWGREIETGMGEVDVNLKADVEQAKKDIEAAAKDQKATIEVDADTATAEAQIDTAARDRKATIKVDADKSVIDTVTSSIDKLGGAFGKIAGVAGGSLKLESIIGAVTLAPNIVPVVGQVVTAVGQLSGLLGLLPGIAGTAGLAMGTLKIATAGFGDAIKAIGDPKKFAEAIAQLSPAAQDAARAIQGLMPQITTLKMTVQNAFFKGFGDQITALGTTYLPIFRTTLGQFAIIANKALSGVADMFRTPEMQAQVQTLLNNLASGFQNLAGAVQPMARAITDILSVSSTFMPGLGKTVADLASRFSDFIRDARDSGKLAGWIQTGIDAFTNLKNIVVNTWDTLKGLFGAAAGPEGAGGLLSTVETLTQKWSNWVNSPVGQNKIKQFFIDAKTEWDKWWPILSSLPQTFWNAFNAAKDAVQPLLTGLQWITKELKDHPGWVDAVVHAFLAWRVIKGVADLTTALKTISTLLRITLVNDAKVAGVAIGANLEAGAVAGATSAVTKVGAIFAALGTGIATIVIPVAFSVIAGNYILELITGQHRDPLQFDLGPSGNNNANANVNPNPPTPIPQNPSYPPDSSQQPPGAVPQVNLYSRLPGQNYGDPPDMPPGSIVTEFTPGAVKDGNDWVIPGIDSTKQHYVLAPKRQSVGGHGAPGHAALPPPAPPADAGNNLPSPDIPSYVPPPANVGGGGGGGGGGGAGHSGRADIGGPVAPSGFDWDAVMPHEGGTWSNADTGHNGHYGGLQFSPETWAAFGGLKVASRADYATPEEQKMIADRTAFYGYTDENGNYTAPQGLGAWEAITKGNVPGITTATVPPRPTPQYGSAISSSSSSSSSSSIGAKVNAGAVPQPPAGGFPGGANVNYTPTTMQSLGIPGLYTNPAGGGAAQIPDWVQDFVKLHGGPSLIAQSTPHPGPSGAPGLHGEAGGPGWAIDVTGTDEDMDRLAQYLVDNPSESAMLIHQSQTSGTKYGVAGGTNVSGTSYFSNDYSSEGKMVHWAPSGPLKGGVSTDAAGNVTTTTDTSTANSKGEDLGKSFVDGLFAAFGFDGTVFKDPRQFGIVKLGTALFNYFNKLGNSIANPTTDANGNPVNNAAGSPGAPAPGGGGDLVNSMLNFIPQPFGAPNVADENAPGAPANIDASTNTTVNIPTAPVSKGEVKDVIQQVGIEGLREPSRSLPGQPSG